MKKKTEIAYHFTGDKLRDGRPIPKIGKWLVEKGEIKICRSGLHASRTPFQALNYAPGFKLHKVEVSDIVAETEDDKLVARRRRIVATIDAEDLILAFARKQALSVIHLYDCPPILKEWLETGNPAIQKDAYAAANAANAAKAADAADAANATYAATYATYAAANAANAAKAADAAANATYAATYAAYAAANATYAATIASTAYAANVQKAANDFNKMVEEAFAMN